MSAAPLELRPLLEKCLEKDPRKRLRDISGVEALLDLGRAKAMPQAKAHPTSEAHPAWTRLLPWAVAAALLVIAAAVSFSHFRETPAEPAVPIRFAMQFPPLLSIPPGIAGAFKGFSLSPDGHFLAFTAADKDGKTSLWLRRLDSYLAQNLDGTAGASMPFWSPDSREIAFFSDGVLKRILLAGGAPVTVCPAPNAAGGSWNQAGQILFGSNRGIHVVSASGGSPSPVTGLDTSKEWALYPVFLPDGDHFLYTLLGSSGGDGGYIQTLGSPERKLVTPDAVGGFAAPNHLIVVRNGAAMVQDLDMTTFALLGDPRVLESEVAGLQNVIAGISVSGNGTAVFLPTFGGEQGLNVYQRDGRRTDLAAAGLDVADIALSPDGRRLVVVRSIASTADLWLLEIVSGVFSRLTSDAGIEVDPVWSPDSQRVLFASRMPGKNELREITVGTSGEKVIYSNPDGWAVDDWSQGKWIVFRGPDVRTRLLLYGEEKPQLVNEVGAGIDQTHVSPDGRWVSYNSSESGNLEVYIAAFPSFQQKRQLSVGGGAQPQWRGDGKELYYLAPDRKLMAVDIKSGTTLETGAAHAVFQTNMTFGGDLNNFVPSPDGQKFYIAEPSAEDRPELRVIVNWPALLKK